MPKAPAASPPPEAHNDIVDLRKALEERYLSYALSTITQRALPDARDGLKPVHRRILHGMRLLRLDPDGAYKKSAKVVGDVMGSFHPHGDQSIYDALVRLAQDFSMRYPLADGQGNFGNIDGDSAAAMRYTETKMTDVAMRLMEGMAENAVDFKPNYDGSDEEPVVLPANFPNLLANGATGIAVGMATSIPPHNVAELCEAALALIARPGLTIEELVHHVPGPDFPTGGVLVESRASILESYSTGRGSFRLRARWHREDKGRGVYQLVVTEIPYGVQKSKLIEKVAELLIGKRLTLLKDIRDESADDIRIVLEPRAGTVDPAVLMEQLFKLTELEQRIPLNMNVLDHGTVPRVMSLGDALRAWLEHRKDVLVRRTQHRLEQIAHRLEVLDGYIVAYLNLDEVIRIIREEDEPKTALIAAFELSEVQANYILDTRLRSLRRLEEMELRREFDELTKEKDDIDKLLADEAKQWKVIGVEQRDLKKKFGQDTALGKRRTQFAEAPEVADFDLATAMIEREPITVVVSEKGWIRALKGHVEDLSGLQFKGDDRLKQSFFTETTEKILVFATDGRIFTLEASKLPGGRGQGEPLRLMADIGEGEDIVSVFPYVAGEKMLVASSDGRGFIAPCDEMVGGTRKGKILLNRDLPAEASIVTPAVGDHVAVIGQNRKLLVFPIEQMPEMTRGKGVRLQRYREGGISDAKVFGKSEGLTWQDSAGRTFSVAMRDLRDWIGNRAEAGRLPPKGFPKNNKFG